MSQAANFGKAVIKLSLLSGDVDKGLKSLQSKVARLGNQLRAMGQKGMLIGGAVAAPFLAMVKGAADAQEGLAKFRAVFGEQGEAAEQFVQKLAETIGRSKGEVRDAMAAYQSFFVGLGFGGQQAMGFSQKLQALALDLAAFQNISDEEATERFISAMSGSSEVLQKFGVNLKQAALREELFRMGVFKSWSEVTEQEKAVARLNVIMQTMTAQGAVGQAEREAGTFANQTKKLTGQIKDLSDEIGAKLLPFVVDCMGMFNQLATAVAGLGPWFTGAMATVGKFAVAFAAASAAAYGFGAALWLLSAHPIIAALTVLALGLKVAWDYFAGAADGASGLNKELDEMAAKQKKLARAQAEATKASEKAREAERRDKSEGDERRRLQDDLASQRVDAIPDELQRNLSKIDLERQRRLRGLRESGADSAENVGMANDLARMQVAALMREQAAKRAAELQEEAARKADETASLQERREQELQRVGDDMERQRIDAIEDAARRERELIAFEHRQRLRDLREQGLLTPDIVAKLDRLTEMKLSAIEMESTPENIADRSREQTAMFDASLAAQTYGSPMEKGIVQIERHTRKMANRRNDGGIPVG